LGGAGFCPGRLRTHGGAREDRRARALERHGRKPGDHGARRPDQPRIRPRQQGHGRHRQRQPRVLRGRREGHGAGRIGVSRLARKAFDAPGQGAGELPPALRVVERGERSDQGVLRDRGMSGENAGPRAEEIRLEDDATRTSNWKRWGPYLSERQWGTVREDYSEYGTAWEYLPHDHARSRTYRWGEDGLLGITDREGRLCFALALWNGRDPILKERLFGLTGNEGNHGEDVKEIYFYLDSTPTHSYMKALYKYPQREFPYGWLVEENRRRGKRDLEFDLPDTGIFDDGRYFDVFVEY